MKKKSTLKTSGLPAGILHFHSCVIFHVRHSSFQSHKPLETSQCPLKREQELGMQALGEIKDAR